jgi:adenosine deaminase
MSDIYSTTPVFAALARRLYAMPKTEIHVHLEGATDAATVWELARRNQITLPAPTLAEWEAMYSFRDFNHFIEIFLLAAQCMRTAEDFAFITNRFFQRQAGHNVRYCEAFLSATLLLDKIPPAEAIAALSEAARQGEARTGIRLRFIPDITRNVPESRFRVLEFALAGMEAGIFIGLGLGGKEIGAPPELFEDVYTEARRQGLHVVAHAGETDGPQSIWGALRSLRSERIGHGIRAVDDPALVEHLAQCQVPLEVSPASNYRLKVVPIDRPHPMRALFDSGVFLTVNTDDPTMFSTDLTSEYLLLASQGFTWDELWQLNCNGISASFLSPEEKAAYRAEWEGWKKDWQE